MARPILLLMEVLRLVVESFVTPVAMPLRLMAMLS